LSFHPKDKKLVRAAISMKTILLKTPYRLYVWLMFALIIIANGKVNVRTTNYEEKTGVYTTADHLIYHSG
jgi:hypothetical protein